MTTYKSHKASCPKLQAWDMSEVRCTCDLDDEGLPMDGEWLGDGLMAERPEPGGLHGILFHYRGRAFSESDLCLVLSKVEEMFGPQMFEHWKVGRHGQGV